MAFASSSQVASIVVNDPTGDELIPVLRAPQDHSITIERAYAAFAADVSGDGTNYIELSLRNGGTAGTATTVISGTAGGTGGWSEQVPQEMSVSAGSGKLSAGQVLVLNYNENGTVGPDFLTVFVEYVPGVGAQAAS